MLLAGLETEPKSDKSALCRSAVVCVIGAPELVEECASSLTDIFETVCAGFEYKSSVPKLLSGWVDGGALRF